MSSSHGSHREVHYLSRDLREPPCETLEDGFEWSDAVEDVTCEACLTVLVEDGGELAREEDDTAAPDDHPSAS